MARPQHYFDWHEIVGEQADDEPVACTRHRLRLILIFFGLAAAMIFSRAVQLEISDGDNFRRRAAEPLERTVSLEARRGQILARDGTVLAADRPARGLAIQYRYLENPPDPGWLSRMVRARLPRGERRQPERVAAMRAQIEFELAAMHRRLAELCGLTYEQWRARIGRIQRRVDVLVAQVDQRRRDRYHARQEQAADEAAHDDLSLRTIVTGLFAPPEPLPPPRVLVVEQTAYHRIVDNLSPEAASEIENNTKEFPGAKIVEYTHREYPGGPLAAHVVGHLQATSGVHRSPQAEPGQDDQVPRGLMGLELQCEALLHGQAGEEMQATDRRGKVLAVKRMREPVAGRDVVVTIDAALQAEAEQALDRAMQRLDKQTGEANGARGGAVVVMDVRSGEILAAASAPRFDPNWFAAGDPRLEAVLNDPRRPLFDRVTKMAIPPGSVFKPLVALALLENHIVDPAQPFRCQGFLNEPDRLRCQIFRQHGIGHGDVTLVDALAQSCNVYFFEHAPRLGAGTLVEFAGRFGFGEPARIELPDEASGQLPQHAGLRQASQIQAFAIGQGAFTATPLQVVRMYAAIANGGYLVAPRLIRPQGIAKRTVVDETAGSAAIQGAPIAGLSPAALAAVREGLRRVVDDPNGTAYATVRLPLVSIAGKTGTAQSGGRENDHAWFAGYAPAETPRCAFVVVLEHGGSGATVAGAVARSLVEHMQQLRYFGPLETADKSIPHGKG
jgi:penicillin-binding protein 2